jgi:hypothetical protein
MYDHQFMESDLVIKRHDSYSWHRFWTIEALVEAVVSSDGFSVIFRGVFAPLITVGGVGPTVPIAAARPC